MAQGYGQYNQFGGYGQIPGQADQTRFPRFGGGQGGGQQYPQGTFQGQQGSQPQQNSSNLSQPPPTGSPNPPASSSSSTQTPSQPTPSPPPVSSGAAGQQAPADNTQYPAGTFPASSQGTTSLYGGSMGTNSTGPVNMMLGQFGAPGAWDGGYSPYFAPPPATASAPTPPAASTSTAAAPTSAAPVSTPQPTAPAVPAAPPPMPTGGSWGDQAHLDYFRQYGAGNSGLSQEQVNALLGQSSQPNAATVAYNQQQQQFGQNNPGYGTSGYWGNAAQVAAQQAEGAQANSIPLGVLGASFGRGGADYGGQQNAGNSMNGNNGATNWNGSNYGVNVTAVQDALRQKQLSDLFAQQGMYYPPGTFGG